LVLRLFKRYGAYLLKEDLALNRKKLTEIVFDDPEKENTNLSDPT
jgi:dephospho-CoA kinase